MKLILVFLISLIATNFCLSQKSELYLFVDDTLYASQKVLIQNDTLKLRSILVKKVIPKEEYVFRLYVDSENQVKKSIPGTTSWGLEGLIDNVVVSVNRKILKSEIDIYKESMIRTSEIGRIEFASLRKVMKEVDLLYFIVDENPESEYYFLYKKYDRR